MAAVALMTLMLSACAGSGSAVLERSLPASPEWVAPVDTPEPRAGEDTLVIAARERAAKAAANHRLIEFAGWYEGVRADYSGARP